MTLVLRPARNFVTGRLGINLRVWPIRERLVLQAAGLQNIQSEPNFSEGLQFTNIASSIPSDANPLLATNLTRQIEVYTDMNGDVFSLSLGSPDRRTSNLY